MIAEVVKLLDKEKVKLPFGLYIVNAVQEEVGLRGAQMIAQKIPVRTGTAHTVDGARIDLLANINLLGELPLAREMGAVDYFQKPFEPDELIAIVEDFRLEPDAVKRFELMSEYNRSFTENIYDIGIVVGSYGLALAERFQNVPVGTPTFLYEWTWANVQPDQVWVMPEEQLPEIYPATLPDYSE